MGGNPHTIQVISGDAMQTQSGTILTTSTSPSVAAAQPGASSQQVQGGQVLQLTPKQQVEQ